MVFKSLLQVASEPEIVPCRGEAESVTVTHGQLARVTCIYVAACQVSDYLPIFQAGDVIQDSQLGAALLR